MSQLSLKVRLYTAGLKAGLRVQRIHELLGVEGAEMFSVGYAFAWGLPLAIYGPTYLRTSPNLQNVAEHVPYSVFLWLMVGLFAWQFTALILGGLPSAFITTATAYQIWRAVRCFGLMAGAFVWFSLAILLSHNGITTGTTLHSLCGVICGWGVWRFDLLRMVDVATAGFKAARAFAAEEELKRTRQDHQQRQRELALLHHTSLP